MGDSQNSDEELLAMLQPPSMPEEFVFESDLPINLDTSDDDNDGNLLPGPAPPAPMAPMMAEDTAITPTAPTVPMESIKITEVAGQVSSTGSANSIANELGGSQPANDAEEDEIAYEPTKTPSRTLRSAKAGSGASRPKSRTYLESSKSRPRPKPGFQAKPKTQQPEPKSESELEQDLGPPNKPMWSFEIVISPLSPQAAQEYEPIPPGDEIYRVLNKIPTGNPGETWLAVEFEDGRIDQVRQRTRIFTTYMSCP